MVEAAGRRREERGAPGAQPPRLSALMWIWQRTSLKSGTSHRFQRTEVGPNSLQIRKEKEKKNGKGRGEKKKRKRKNKQQKTKPRSNSKCFERKDSGNTTNIFQLNYFLWKIPDGWKPSDNSFTLLQFLRRARTSVLAISSLFTASTSCPRCLQRAETSSDRTAHRGSSDRSGPRRRPGTRSPQARRGPARLQTRPSHGATAKEARRWMNKGVFVSFWSRLCLLLSFFFFFKCPGARFFQRVNRRFVPTKARANGRCTFAKDVKFEEQVKVEVVNLCLTWNSNISGAKQMPRLRQTNQHCPGYPFYTRTQSYACQCMCSVINTPPVILLHIMKV